MGVGAENKGLSGDGSNVGEKFNLTGVGYSWS
jgi:hypothetical protein